MAARRRLRDRRDGGQESIAGAPRRPDDRRHARRIEEPHLVARPGAHDTRPSIGPGRRPRPPCPRSASLCARAAAARSPRPPRRAGRSSAVPRRAQTPRKAKYAPTLTRTTDRFVVKIMRDGKKGLAESILRQALPRAEASARRPGLEVLDAALRNATPIIEVKPRRVGGATYQVPVEIRGDRRMSLGVRWLVQSARKRSGKSMSEKLAAELVDAMNGLGAAVKRREDTHKMAEANKAFSHFKW